MSLEDPQNSHWIYNDDFRFNLAGEELNYTN